MTAAAVQSWPHRSSATATARTRELTVEELEQRIAPLAVPPGPID